MDRPLPSPADVFRAIPCFCGRLLLASRAMSRLYNDELRHSGIEITQFSLLQLLSQLGPMTQNELGDRMAAGKTTISRNVKLLEQHGWVSVEPGEDRRSRIVSLTSAGRKQLQRTYPHWERAQARIRAAIPGPQFKELT